MDCENIEWHIDIETHFKLIDKSGNISDLPLANTRSDLTSLEIKKNSRVLRLTKSGISINNDTFHDKIGGPWVTLTYNSTNYETIALGHFNTSIG